MTDSSEIKGIGNETFRAPKDFSEIDFSELEPFGEKNLARGKDYNIRLPVQIENTKFNLVLGITVTPGNDGKIHFCEMDISLFDQSLSLPGKDDFFDATIYGTITFDFTGPSGAVETNTVITRNPMAKGAENLPTGIGVEVYQKMLDFISKQTEVFKKDIMHKVQHSQRLGLTPDKWNKIFVPILTERGYTDKGKNRSGDQEWTKLYKHNPENASSH